MSGEINNSFNPKYSNSDEYIKSKIEREKFHRSSQSDFNKQKEERNTSLVVNGKAYSSLQDAANDLGCSVNSIRTYYKKLLASKRTEMEFNVMIKKTLVIKKVREL